MLNLDLSTTLTHLPEPPTHTRRPFLTPLPEPGHFLLVLDNTGLEKVKRCHMAARNYLILGREPHAKNAALTFGGAIHEGLESYLRGEPSAIQDSKIANHFANNPAPPDEYRTPNTAIEVLKHYRDRSNILLYPDYEWEILTDDKGLIIERAFELPLGVLEVGEWVQMPNLSPEELNRQEIQTCNPPNVYLRMIHLAWSGRIDAIAKTHGHTCVVDHKTTSIAGDQFTQSFQLSSQVMGYAWAASQLWPNLAPFAFCLNAIALKKPGVNQGLMSKGVRGGEAPLSFFRAFFPTTTEGYYTPERLAEWSNDTVSFIEDFLHSLVRNHFPLNDRQCFDKFGRCSYHDVCTIDEPQVREKLLHSDAFKDVTWNPLNGR